MGKKISIVKVIALEGEKYGLDLLELISAMDATSSLEKGTRK